MSEAESSGIPVKLCVECTHHGLRENRATEQFTYHACNFVRSTVDVVTGGNLVEDRGCYHCRSGNGFCGPSGRFWEAK